MSRGAGSGFAGKIVFFGTANVALPILEELKKQHDIVAVVTTPDATVGRKQELTESPVSALAKDLKLTLLKPEKVKGNQEFLNQLQSFGADIFVVVAYGKILPLDIINMPRFKTINVHFSILPKYRGSSPIQYALLNGDTQTGTSIFILDEKVDTGSVLAQERTNIESWDSFFTLSDKLSKVSAKLINPTLERYVKGEITPLPQNEAEATYTNTISKQDGKIEWEKTAVEIYNKFRAFFPWPGIWTSWNGQNLKITDCVPVVMETEPLSVLPGTVLENGIVACGNNTYLKINQLQLAGKNEVLMVDFLNGYQAFIGSQLS